MSTYIYLTVADDAAWHDLAVLAWGMDDDKPAIPVSVSVDGPFAQVDEPTVFDDDGALLMPAAHRNERAINLAAPSGFIWPDAIITASLPVGTPNRVFAR